MRKQPFLHLLTQIRLLYFISYGIILGPWLFPDTYIPPATGKRFKGNICHSLLRRYSHTFLNMKTKCRGLCNLSGTHAPYTFFVTCIPSHEVALAIFCVDWHVGHGFQPSFWQHRFREVP